MPLSPEKFKTLCEAIVAQGYEKMHTTHAAAVETQHAGGLVVIRHQPHRRCFLKELHQPGCPFCRDRATDFLMEVPYQGMLLSHNLGPYGPMSLILRTRLHHEQDEIIDFLDSHGRHWIADLPPQMTLFCNQFAGNSQRHLHLQYLDRLLPITQLSHAGEDSHPLHWQSIHGGQAHFSLLDGSQADGAVTHKPIQHFKGCFIRGAATVLARAMTHYLRTATQQGFQRFNFAIWREAQSDRFVGYICLRNPETLRTKNPDFPVLVGALTTCGLITEERLPHQMPAFDYAAFVAHMNTKLLPPIAPWPTPAPSR